MTKIMIASAALLMASAAHAHTIVSPQPTPVAISGAGYTQNFNTLASTGRSNGLPQGFHIAETGTGAAVDGQYVADNGSSSTGNAFSYGATGNSERALGSLASGGNGPIRLGAIFTNNAARGAISAINISYVGEQWRAGNSRDDGLFFEYSTSANAIHLGQWTRVSALDFLPLVTGGNRALNGNLAANQRMLSANLSGLSPIASGGLFAIRWTDFNSSGNDHGLGIDDLAIRFTFAAAVPEPSTWAMMILGVGATGTALRRKRRLAQA